MIARRNLIKMEIIGWHLIIINDYLAIKMTFVHMVYWIFDNRVDYYAHRDDLNSIDLWRV